MKALKWLGIILGVLIVLFLVVGAILPSTYTIERDIVIASSSDVVYNQITNFEERLNWSPWIEMEPSAEVSIEGVAGEVGHSWSWNGDTVGVGTLTLKEMVPGKSVKEVVEFKSPQSGMANESFTLEEVENGVKVTLNYNMDLGYPVERYLGFFVFDSMLGKTFEKGLSNLKQVSEAMPVMEEEETTAKEEGGV